MFVLLCLFFFDPPPPPSSVRRVSEPSDWYLGPGVDEGLGRVANRAWSKAHIPTPPFSYLLRFGMAGPWHPGPHRTSGSVRLEAEWVWNMMKPHTFMGYGDVFHTFMQVPGSGPVVPNPRRYVDP